MRRAGAPRRSRTRHPQPPEPLEPGAPVIAARGVTVHLGGRSVLEGAGIAVAAGEVVALVGPNGAGKSTFLAALAGDVDVEGGDVELLGSPLGAWSAGDLALRRSVLPQQVTVTFPFTVREVVEMGRAPWVHVDGDPDGERVVDAVLVECDVDHLAHRHIPTLSGGERARVALARVLAQEAPLLFLDEPTAALDLHHQELVLRLARTRAERGVGVVVVLHDLGLAAAHADRIAILSGGRVVADGPPTTVLEDSLLSAVYHHPIEVLSHPRTGAPLVLPRR